ncbi:unnamed protein product [Ceutorhynchus assimilis]|uniref:DUF8207 domain-containing protein n=1 Tax=Ceutorhynchus assimilis TaxID=467358 RepID=A0A9N9MWM9_9CUCU|nr:unnamed protein product [Ceutorhynchus assimilis]
MLKNMLQMKSKLENKIYFNESRQNEFISQSQTEYLNQFDPLPAKYIQEFINDRATDPTLEGNVLHKFRIRRDEIDNFYIGDSKVEIVGSDQLVKRRTYKGTPGLYKLLFRKNIPKSYTKDDEAAFKDIISRTNINRIFSSCVSKLPRISCDIPNKRKFEEMKKFIFTYRTDKCFNNYQSQPWDEEGYMKMEEDMDKAENYDAATRKYWGRIQAKTIQYYSLQSIQ